MYLDSLGRVKCNFLTFFFIITDLFNANTNFYLGIFLPSI